MAYIVTLALSERRVNTPRRHNVLSCRACRCSVKVALLFSNRSFANSDRTSERPATSFAVAFVRVAGRSQLRHQLIAALALSSLKT